MADEKQVRRLLDGVERWNECRAENSDVEIDLSVANLRRANLRYADLRRANLRYADLSYANLIEANLSDADLRHAKIRRANLIDADLSGANLTSANLIDANFIDTDLTGANLSSADLSGADLTGANLSETDLRRAKLIRAFLSDAYLTETGLGFTAFGSCDLSATKGLEIAKHRYPSTIGTDTLELTARGLAKNPSNRGPVEKFLRAAGVSEDHMQTFALAIENPIEFYSCFISYSHEDKAFARRVYDSLQGRGIRCWLDEKKMKVGDKILPGILEAIRLYDTVLLCCSEASLQSDWVERELEATLQREMREMRLLIRPLNLDGYLFKGYSGTFLDELQSRLAADFTGWESDNQKFENQFERVVKALRTERGAESEPNLFR